MPLNAPNGVVPNRISTHERAVEIGRKGGLTNTLKKSWTKQRYCSVDCHYKDGCPSISTSQTLDLADFQWVKNKWVRLPEKRILAKKDKKYHPCFLKTQTPEIQNDFMNIFSNGEEGIISVIMDLFYQYVSRSRVDEISMKEMRESIETSLAVKKSLYGDKQKVELSGNVGVVFYLPENNRDKKVIDITNDESEA